VVPSTTLADLSNTLFTTAIAVYSLAMVCFCGEYAFGRRGRVARTSVSAVPAEAPVLVGAGGTAPGTLPPADRKSPIRPTRRFRGPGRAAGRFGRAAIGLTVLGALLHAGSISIRGAAVDRVPWGNMYEFSSAVGLVAVVAFVVLLVRQPALRHLGAFVLLPVIVVMFLAGTVLYAKAEPLVPALHSYWLAIHVSAAALATGIFMVSGVATTLYLIRSRWDVAVAVGRTPRFPASLGSRLPDADSLDRMAYRTIAFGFPIWTFGIICGAIWAEAAWGRYWGWDPKETWAFIAWVIYAAYLHARATAGWKGTRAATINLLGFGAMTFNFFVVNIVISGLHSYAGLN
jgi:cytochrome c-type biogenesis protein CcsB